MNKFSYPPIRIRLTETRNRFMYFDPQIQKTSTDEGNAYLSICISFAFGTHIS
jgi:hypothetical protein